MLFLSFRTFRLKNFSSITNYKYGTVGRSIHQCAASFQKPGDASCEPTQKKVLMDPACKVALLTNVHVGAVSFEIARQLLQNGAKNVVITGGDMCAGREAAQKLNAMFGKDRAMFIGACVTCMVQFEEAFKTAKQVFKDIDIFVNCSNLFDGKNWESEVVTNVVGKIRGCLLANKYMGKDTGGRGGVVLNVAAIYGIEPLIPGPTFAATQFANVGLSRSFGNRIHTEKTGIRTTQVLLGYPKTPLYKAVEKKGMTPYMCLHLGEHFGKVKKQSARICGMAGLHIIKSGDNGSVWVLEDANLYEVNFPSWEKFGKLAAQFI